MAWQFRKSKKFGPFRLTLGKRGLSASAGGGPLRFSANTRGEVRRTVRVPGAGVYNTKKINGRKRGSAKQREAEVTRQRSERWHELHATLAELREIVARGERERDEHVMLLMDQLPNLRPAGHRPDGTHDA